LGFVYLDYMKGLVRYILVLVFLACVSYGCRKDVEGCMDIKASNFNPHATLNDGSCNYDVTEKLGCTNPVADNYNPTANMDDGTCIFRGCTNPEAINYNYFANEDDGSCIIVGCMDPDAINYNPSANQSSGACDYDWGPGYAGTWTGLNCSVDFQNSLLLEITYDTNVANTIVFVPMFLDLSTRYATVNGKNITFPSQSFGIGGLGSMTGTGVLSTLPDTTLICNFTYDDGLFINGTCAVTYTKQ